ncbi:MAG TPA: hypothetical protein VMW75_08370 [Thermoanaerobaculia bacterium]|nr:hypothetical protein [Thermoanaerobaculia bacterium]
MAGLAVLAALAAVPVSGSQWTQIGPPGSPNVVTFAGDPQHPAIVFAGLFGGGIARSADAGLTWKAANQGVTEPNVTFLVVHPQRADLVLARSDSGRLLRSLDGGLSWQELEAAEAIVAAVAPAPTDPNLIYAASSIGVLVSRDQGGHWGRVGGRGLPPHYQATALAVDARDPRLLYAGIAHYTGFGFWISDDAGETWRRGLHGVPDQLVADPLRSGTVYLFKYGNVQRSRDRGVTWEPYFGATYALTLALDRRHPWIAFMLALGGPTSAPRLLFKTTDDGGHWLPVAVPDVGYYGTGLGLTAGGVLLVSRGANVLRSADDGASWAEAGSGLINTSIGAVAAGGEGTLYASSGNLIAHTRDGGASWSSASLPFYNGVTALAVDPRDPSIVYAATTLPPGVAPPILWKSTDGGDSWFALPYPSAASQPFSGIHGTDVAVDPFDSQVVYLATHYDLVENTGGEGLYRSADGGQSWVKSPLSAGDVLSVVLVPSRPGTVWVVGQNGVYVSGDDGQSWTTVLLSSQFNYVFTAVAPAPSNPDVVWVLANNNTYRSVDGGATWQRTRGLVPSTYFPFYSFGHRLAVDPFDAGRIYVAWDGGVSRLSWGGPWQDLDGGLVNRSASCILFDPADPRRLLAGSGGAGVFEISLAPDAIQP